MIVRTGAAAPALISVVGSASNRHACRSYIQKPWRRNLLVPPALGGANCASLSQLVLHQQWWYRLCLPDDQLVPPHHTAQAGADLVVLLAVLVCCLSDDACIITPSQ